MPLRPYCIAQADDETIDKGSQHLLASRNDMPERTGLGVLNLTEVHRAQAAIQQYWERKAMGQTLCEWTDLFIHVGDDPRPTEQGKPGWLTWSACSGKLPCIRRTGGLYVSASLERHLTLEELYGCMGFPSLPVFSKSAAVPLYKIDRTAFRYLHFRRALGNSQHVAQVGTFMSASLAACAFR